MRGLWKIVLRRPEFHVDSEVFTVVIIVRIVELVVGLVMRKAKGASRDSEEYGGGREVRWDFFRTRWL